MASLFDDLIPGTFKDLIPGQESKALNEFAQRAASMDPMDLSVARSKNDEFGDYLRAQASQPQAGETEATTIERQYGKLPETAERIVDENPVLGAGAKFVQGYPLVGEYIDEAAQYLPGIDPQTTNLMRDVQSTMDEKRPGLAMASEIGGGVAGSIPMAIAAGPTLAASAPASLGGQVMYGTGLGMLGGGVEGSVAGYGSGEDAESRKRNAITRGLIGTGFGGVAGGAAPLIAKGVSNVATKYRDWKDFGKAAKAQGLGPESTQFLTRAMQGDDALTGAGQQRIAAAGPDAMVADAGPVSGAILDASIHRGGPPANIGYTATEQRATKAGQKLVDTLDDTLGGAPQGIKGMAKEVSERTAPARKAAYDLAYSKPIDYSASLKPGKNITEIEDVISRVPKRTLKSAIDEANDAMQAAGERNLQILADIADDGTVTFKEMPNVKQLDELKKALNQVASQNVDEFGRPTAAGIRASNLARELRDATSEAVPEYKAAVELGGDKIAEDNALRVGRDIFKMNREDVARAADGMLPVERNQASRAIRYAIDEKMANVKRAMVDGNMDAREAWVAVRDMSSRANKEKVSELIGDDAAEKLFKELDQAASAFEIRGRVVRNSATAPRMTAQKDAASLLEGGAGRKLLELKPVESAQAMAGNVFGQTPMEKLSREDQMWSEIANLLTKPRGDDAITALSVLANSAQRSPVNAALGELLGNRAATAAGLAGYQTGTRAVKGPQQ